MLIRIGSLIIYAMKILNYTRQDFCIDLFLFVWDSITTLLMMYIAKGCGWENNKLQQNNYPVAIGQAQAK